MRDTRLAEAYATCRAIAKREAKNFYYAFRVLPQHKSDAMCAVYAFMRKADDLADDESMSIEARRHTMAAWTAEWRASRTQATQDDVFLALKDTQKRFGISDDLLEQLVAGTTMDLQESPEGAVIRHDTTITAEGKASETFQIFESFDDLYRYCYLVASVVGLVCIRIFGYEDPRAEKFAEETGIAFQLTNIVRDIKEDTERGRVYLPLDDLRKAGLEVEQLSLAGKGAWLPPGAVEALQIEISRAKEYYRAADQLIPLLEKDSRPAMRVLVRIYQRLLDLIAGDPAAVFRGRVSVPTSEKLLILAGGAASALKARVWG